MNALVMTYSAILILSAKCGVDILPRRHLHSINSANTFLEVTDLLFITKKPIRRTTFFFHSDVAFFDINKSDGSTNISSKAYVDINEVWVEDRLGLDSTTCTFKSIVIIAHSWPKESLYDKIDEYFDACGATLPILSISGNTQPRTYCMTQNATSTRVNVTVEAFESGPLLISVVRDPDGGGDFFHVEDVDLTDSNRQCPSFSGGRYLE